MIFSAPLSLGKTEHPASIRSVNFLISLNDRNNLLVQNNSLYCFPFAVTLSPSMVNDFFPFGKNTLALPDFSQNVLPYSHTPSQCDSLMSHIWICTVEQSFLLLQIIVPQTFHFHFLQQHIVCVSHDSQGCSGLKALFNITFLSRSLTFCATVSLMSKTGFMINPS